jgi:hypothetical protein
MSTSTLAKHGTIYNIGVDVTIIPVSGVRGEVHYNPGLARDDKGNLWISIRSCDYNPKRWKGWEHPMHWQNYLNYGLLDENTLKISKLKEIKPLKDYNGHHWGFEDARLFWRKDGMHAIGVVIPIENGKYATSQAEILIDYEKGTYKLIKNYGRPKGTMEKNWSPPESESQLFDFAYSMTEVVKDEKVKGDDNHLAIHNGTKLLPYEDGYIQINHVVCGIGGERTYAQVAVRRNLQGYATHISQLFHFNVGWREKLQETIEFVSDMVWSKGKEGKELLVGLGVKDEALGIAKIPVDKFIWDEGTDVIYYRWKWATPPNRKEIPTPTSARPDWH